MTKKTILWILSVGLLAALFWPKARADHFVHVPGGLAHGPNGPACFCPIWESASCGCAIHVQSPEY